MSIVRWVDAVGVTGEDVVVQRSGGVDGLGHRVEVAAGLAGLSMRCEL
jgi:hypothetical protein